MSTEIFDFLKTNPAYRDQINESLKCGLCRSLMINASFTNCGCDFCHDCIFNHLQGSSRTCPTCKTENISSDVTVNISNQRKINLLLVKCNNENCNVIDSVSNVVEHMKHCVKQKKTCPFSCIGCTNEKFGGLEEINCHFNTELIKHNQILLDENKNIKEVINNLKQDIEIKNNKINELHTNIETLTNQNQIFLNTNKQYGIKFEELERKICHLEQGERNMNREILNYKDQVDVIANHPTGHLESKIEIIEKKFSEELFEMKKKYAENNDKILKLQNDFSRQNKEIQQSIPIIEKKQDTEEVEKEKLWMDLGFVNYGEFVWKLDKLSEKKKKASEGGEEFVESDVFYSHKCGYLIKLRCFPNGYGVGKGSHLSLFFVLMKGQFDDFLSWPYKRRLCLSLVNQETSEEEEVRNYRINTAQEDDKDSYDKPTDTQNVSHGLSNFLPWTKLQSSPHLFRNDSISIKCSTSF